MGFPRGSRTKVEAVPVAGRNRRISVPASGFSAQALVRADRVLHHCRDVASADDFRSTAGPASSPGVLAVARSKCSTATEARPLRYSSHPMEAQHGWPVSFGCCCDQYAGGVLCSVHAGQSGLIPWPRMMGRISRKSSGRVLVTMSTIIRSRMIRLWNGTMSRTAVSWARSRAVVMSSNVLRGWLPGFGSDAEVSARSLSPVTSPRCQSDDMACLLKAEGV